MPNSITELEEIKTYIIEAFRCLGTIPTDARFFQDVEKFLDRLIKDQEGTIHKDPYQLKAGRQLLCCIGIDIASGTVPVDHYLQVFQAIDLLNEERQARHLFWDCLRDNNLLYKESERKETGDYNVMICPIKDWEYYIDKKTIGVVGIRLTSFVHKELIKAEKKGTLRLCSSRLDKRSAYSHFWITTGENIDSLLSGKEAAKDIVDKLGLSHFDFSDVNYRHYFRIRIGKESFETFKPNATIVDWTNPKVGFLSFRKEEAGRTFSISGYQAYQEGGMKERVFNTLQLSPKEVEESHLHPLTPPIKQPPDIQCDEIIAEGIKRFKDKNHPNHA